MAAKKAPAKKAAPAKKPPAPTPPPKATTTPKKKPMGLAQSLPAKPKVNKVSQAGDLGSERSTMREMAQLNRKFRKNVGQYKGQDVGLVASTYRDQKGKLQVNVGNLKFGASFPKGNYVSLPKKKKK